MNRYVIRVDYTVDAETEEEALEQYIAGKAMYDSVYEIDIEESFVDDEEEQA
jgi:hypothetical protein